MDGVDLLFHCLFAPFGDSTGKISPVQFLGHRILAPTSATGDDVMLLLFRSLTKLISQWRNVTICSGSIDLAAHVLTL